jgi:hypothetical protein
LANQILTVKYSAIFLILPLLFSSYFLFVLSFSISATPVKVLTLWDILK